MDEKVRVVMCLSEAADSNAIIKTHKEAHGLIPVEILKVKQTNKRRYVKNNFGRLSIV